MNHDETDVLEGLAIDMAAIAEYLDNVGGDIMADRVRQAALVVLAKAAELGPETGSDLRAA